MLKLKSKKVETQGKTSVSFPCVLMFNCRWSVWRSGLSIFNYKRYSLIAKHKKWHDSKRSALKVVFFSGSTLAKYHSTRDFPIRLKRLLLQTTKCVWTHPDQCRHQLRRQILCWTTYGWQVVSSQGERNHRRKHCCSQNRRFWRFHHDSIGEFAAAVASIPETAYAICQC